MVKIKPVKKLLERIPFILIMVIGLGIGALITNTTFEGISHLWLQRVGFTPNDLWFWPLERIVTSALVTVGGMVFWEALFFVSVFVGMAEWLAGSVPLLPFGVSTCWRGM